MSREKSQSPKKTPTPEYMKTTKVTRKAKTAPKNDAPKNAEPYDDDDLVPIVKTSIMTKKRTPRWKRIGLTVINYGKTFMKKLNNKEQQSKAVEDWTNERKALIANKDQHNIDPNKINDQLLMPTLSYERNNQLYRDEITLTKSNGEVLLLIPEFVHQKNITKGTCINYTNHTGTIYSGIITGFNPHNEELKQIFFYDENKGKNRKIEGKDLDRITLCPKKTFRGRLGEGLRNISKKIQKKFKRKTPEDRKPLIKTKTPKSPLLRRIGRTLKNVPKTIIEKLGNLTRKREIRETEKQHR